MGGRFSNPPQHSRQKGQADGTGCPGHPQSGPSEPRYGERDDPASQASHCGSPLPAPRGTFRRRETGAECSVSQTRVMSSAMPGPGAPVVMATTSTAAATGLPSSPSIALRHRSRAYSITAQRGSRSSSAASAATGHGAGSP